MILNQDLTQAVDIAYPFLLSLYAFSEPRSSRTLEQVEANKSRLTILRNGSRISRLAQTGFTDFGKGVQLKPLLKLKYLFPASRFRPKLSFGGS